MNEGGRAFRGIDYKARDRLRQNRPDNYFVPSIGVFRRISTDDGNAKKMQTAIARALKSGKGGLPRRHSRHYRPTDMSRQSVSIIEQKKMVHNLREAGARPTPEEMKELAQRIVDVLSMRLSNTPAHQILPLGEFDTFGNNDQTLVVGPRGWRGHNARYATEDEQGLVTPLGTLVGESQLCRDAIASLFIEPNTGVDPEKMVGVPHLSLVQKDGPIQKHELRQVSPSLHDLLPESLTLEDPVVVLRTHLGNDGFEEIPVLRQAA